MSRYNGTWHDATKPFAHIAFLVFVVPPVLLYWGVLRVVYGKQRADEKMDDLVRGDSE